MINKKTEFEKLCKIKTLIFDGAMGTSIQTAQINKKLSDEDFIYDKTVKEGCNEILTINKPEIIKDIHKSFLDAGADCLETNTFGANLIKLKEYGLEHLHNKINSEAVTLAKKAIEEYQTSLNSSQLPKLVFGSLGPSGMLPSLQEPGLSDIAFDELSVVYYKQAKSLIDSGVDGIIIETCQDILEMKATIFGVKKYLSETRTNIPIIAQITLDVNGRMLEGTDIDSALTTIESLDVDVIGLNCSTGPQEMVESLRFLSENSSVKIWEEHIRSCRKI